MFLLLLNQGTHLTLFLDFTEEVKLAQLVHLHKEIEAMREQEQFVKPDSETWKEPDTCRC